MDKGFKERKKTRKPGCLEIVTVCSIHFIDGIPTAANPVPSLHFGYEKKFQNPGESYFASRSKRREKQRKINKD